MKYNVFAERQQWGRAIAIHLQQDLPGDKIAVATSITFETIDPATVIHQPVLSLDITTAQRLMDELWHCGLRPSEGSGSAGSLAATERHLEDMRSIVFKTAPKGRK